jgi:O-antigen/teichoic acid export membrane protein
LKPAAGRFGLAGTLAKGVISQAILSAANFTVGLLLLRYTSNDQYGYYVLVFSGVLMLTSLQGAFVGPAMVNQLTRLGPQQRSDLIGGLYAGQRWAVACLIAIAGGGIMIMRATRELDTTTTWLLLAALAAGSAALYRQFFRMVSNAYRNAAASLRGDVVYSALLLCGAGVAIATSVSAIVIVAFMSVASLVAGWVNARAMRRQEGWNVHASKRVWRGVALVGIWTATGSLAHWVFNQGYNYLIAGVVNLSAVAALGATRTLMMPVTLLSTGVSALMLATVADWLRDHGVRGTLRRVTLSALGMAALAIIYAALFWPVRDFIFTTILRKDFAQRDILLLVWWLASVAMLARDQFTNFLLARARYRSLTALTIISALVGLAVTGGTIGRLGPVGAAMGVLCGEIANVLGLITLSWLDIRPNPRRGLTAADDPRETRASDG